MNEVSEDTLKELYNRPASQSCRLLDFDSTEIRPGIVDETWFLVVKGTAPCANMRIELRPLVYVKRPEYWEIEVVGCVSGPFCLPEVKPFTEVLDLAGSRGTAGIEVVGASKRKRIDVGPLVLSRSTASGEAAPRKAR